MIGLLVVCLVASAAAQQIDDCPAETLEIANFRYFTRDLPPITIPNVLRVEKDGTYAPPEIQTALEGIDLQRQLEIPFNYSTNPFVERCCDKFQEAEDSAVLYQCSSDLIELRYIRYQNGFCFIVWPEDFFVFTRCTCCTCVLDDKCPTVGRCVEADYVTIKVIAYCAHIMYSDRFQKLAIRIPTSCKCAASCPVPQDYFYKKSKTIW